MNDKEKHTPQINTFIVTGDVCNKVEDYNGEPCWIYGKNAVKVTVEINQDYSPKEIIETLTDIFQKTIQSFQQFS